MSSTAAFHQCWPGAGANLLTRLGIVAQEEVTVQAVVATQTSEVSSLQRFQTFARVRSVCLDDTWMIYFCRIDALTPFLHRRILPRLAVGAFT